MLIPVIAVLTAAGFGLSLVVFYPGVMTYDAGYVYDAIARGGVGDWQSPVMSALWAVIDPLAPGAASMFLLIAGLYWLGFLVLALRIARSSPRLGLAVPVLALSPPAFVFVGMIWRDVLMAGLFLLAAASAFAVADSFRRRRAAVLAGALGLVALGVLLRPNALLAAPILCAYILWPRQFSWRRAALLYAPAALALFALMQLVYYDMIGAARLHPVQSIMVFDLGGISHFTGANSFPGTWTPEESALVAGSCYRPTEWDIYWWRLPCSFVMQRLEEAKIFGTAALEAAWRGAILDHPGAYLRHRAAFMANFLAGANPAMWTEDITDHTRTVFADRPAFLALKAAHDWLQPTFLFRAGFWLLVDVAVVALAWRRRATSHGAFAVAVCLSAVLYVLSFAAIGVASDFRYAYWAVLAAIAGAVAAAMPPTS